MGEKIEPDPAIEAKVDKFREAVERERGDRGWTSTGNAWTILCVRPLMERKVAEVLREVLKLQVYVPVETYKPITANVARAHKPWRPRTRALIPGIIFALLETDEALDGARSNDAVRRILCDKDGKPLKVSAIEIGTLVLFEAAGAFDRTRKASGAGKGRGRRRGKRGPGEFESRWKAGQRVKISDGPFAGFLATIMRADREDRIEALVSIFGRETPIQLDETWIEGGDEAPT